MVLSWTAILQMPNTSLEQPPSLLLFSALSMPPFRSVKLRKKSPQCAACGTIGEIKGTIDETDYVAFCGGSQPDWETRGLLPGETGTRMTPLVSRVLIKFLKY
jgi:adenylyltransferase and sulfurtransferase